MSLFQVDSVKPLIEAAKKNRERLLFVTCAPDPPNAWRMQIVGLSQKGCDKVRKIIKQELVTRNLKAQFETELGITLIAEEENLFWICLNPVSTLSEKREAEEKLYDLLKNRGVRIDGPEA